MRVTISGIGILRDASVICNPVAVITGKNGSGKSTFGKAFYSVAEGISSFADYYDRDFIRHIQTTIKNEFFDSRTNTLRWWRLGETNRSLYKLAMFLSRSIYPAGGIESYCAALRQKVQDLRSSDELLVSGNLEKAIIPSGDLNSFISGLLSRIDSLEEESRSESYRNKYLERRIKDEINELFLGQVVTDNYKNAESKIEIDFEPGLLSYSYSSSSLQMSKGAVERLGDVFYISDGNILDQLDRERGFFQRSSRRKDTTTVMPEEDLFVYFRNPNSLIRFDAEERYASIIDILNQIYPYEIYFSHGKTYTTNNGISISNEASGRKVFALIKYLLFGGALNDRTVLLFDEPENHLHPEWQVLFARLIKEIAEKTGTKVLCVTHSPTMLFAFDKIYGSNRNGLSVYYSEVFGDTCLFKNCSKDIWIAHKALSDPFIKLDLLDN